MNAGSELEESGTLARAKVADIGADVTSAQRLGRLARTLVEVRRSPGTPIQRVEPEEDPRSDRSAGIPSGGIPCGINLIGSGKRAIWRSTKTIRP